MHIKICSRCHFAVAMKRRICQVCGGKSFSEIAVAEEPVKKQTESAPVTDALKGFAHTFWVDVQETAHRSKCASQHVAKLLFGEKGADAQDASQR